MYGFVRRAFPKRMGFNEQDLARPVIAQTQNDLNNCNKLRRAAAFDFPVEAT
jgi:hypothetical protein